MNRMRVTLRYAALAAILTLLLGFAASAGAKQAFAPKPGRYTGTAKSGGKTVPASGSVSLVVGKSNLQVLAPATFTCTDGTSVVSSVNFIAPVKSDKSFSYKAVVSGIKFTVSGRFTSESALTGTASREGPKSELEQNSPICSTGKVSFSLHLK